MNVSTLSSRRHYQIIPAKNGGTVVCDENTLILGAYTDSFAALADIARDMGFSIELQKGVHQAQGNGFYPKPTGGGVGVQTHTLSHGLDDDNETRAWSDGTEESAQ